MRKLKFLLIAGVVFFLKCTDNNKTSAPPHASIKGECPVNQYQLQSLLWYQSSGELVALYYQGYNIAKLILDKKLALWKKKSKAHKKEKASVVVDIDETLLNNSPFQGDLLKKNVDYSDSLWTDWVSSGKAEALPGALEFLKYAEANGVSVFYVSNRYQGFQKEKTRQNLERLGFPYTRDTTNMLFRSDASSKEKRRVLISKNYDILLLCGDNLSDFSAVFDNRDKDRKIDSVNKYKSDFGESFIVLPNPMYGDWEKFFWKGLKNLLPEKKDSLRHSLVEGI